MNAPSNLPSKRDFLATGLTRTDDFSSRVDGQCPVCILQLAEHQAVVTECGHVYCNDCAKQWFEENHTCPDCRRQLYEPPEHAWVYDIRPRDLDFEINEDDLRTHITVFDDIMVADDSDFAIAQPATIFVDYDELLPQAVAAAIWLKPDNNTGFLTDVQLCRAEWVRVCHILQTVLNAQRDAEMTVESFLELLNRALYEDLEFEDSNRTKRMPAYGEDVEARNFVDDIKTLVEWIAYCAHEAHENR